MRTTLTASALKAVYSASPADPDLLRAANAAKARPAMIPIEPPSAAEIAPCIPASQANSRLAAAVHKTCSPIIGRNTCHTACSSCKTAEFYRETGGSVKPARRKIVRISPGFAQPERSDRVEQRFGRNVRIEHAQFLPEVQAAAGDRDAVVVVARDEVLGALPGEGAQDLEVRLHAQLLVGGGLDAEVRDEVPLRVRFVVLGLADRDDPVAHGGLGGKRNEALVGAQAQVAPRGDAVGAGIQEELRPLLEPAAVQAFGVAGVELLDVEPQLCGEYGLFRDGHGLSDLFDASNCQPIRHGAYQA